MKIYAKQIICLSMVGLFLISTNTSAVIITKNSFLENNEDTNGTNNNNDIIIQTFDSNPLDSEVDYKLNITIKEIRAFDKIDLIGDPDFYVKIYINDKMIQSDTWHNQKYVNESWSEIVDVPDDIEVVSIKIQLWDRNPGIDKLCDIGSLFDDSQFDKKDIDIVYSLKTGHWGGDDHIRPSSNWNDPSGYGRANGCDDSTFYQNDRDCELIFDITQNDPDGDGIPSWTEQYIYHTDPNVDNTGWDNDSDGVPIEWEWKWGNRLYFHWRLNSWVYDFFYDPNTWEDHDNLDFDEDGIDNVEEYLTSQWGSDPFRQDIFLEVDQMKKGPNGQGGFIPDLSYELLRDAYGKRNIVIHIDDGCMGGGQKNIPFEYVTTHHENLEYYQKYFLNNNPNNWRRGVFRYAIIVFNGPHAGYSFRTEVGNEQFADSFSLSTDILEAGPLYNRLYRYVNIIRHRSFDKEFWKVKSYAGITMHEIGHTLNIAGPGHGRGYHLKYIRYRSCMNYDNVYWLVDYSDGSHGKYDWDDWSNIDLTYFQE